MHAAVIAAGEGTRLSPDFHGMPKPMVTIRGKALIDWLFDTLIELHFSAISIVVRESHKLVIKHLKQKRLGITLNLVCCDTQGGMQSVFCLEPFLKKEEKFFLFTIDNIFDPADLRRFINDRQLFSHRTSTCWTTLREESNQGQVGVMVNRNQKITAIGKDVVDSEFVAEGPMHCFPSFFDARQTAVRAGICRLSEYMKHLLDEKHPFYAYPVSDVFDVDDIEDHRRATAFLAKLAERNA